MSGWLLAVALITVLGIGGCASPTSSEAAASALEASSSPLPSAIPAPGESALSSACQPLPHEAPDLETLLPSMVAGLHLVTWSVRGEKMITCLGGGTAEDVAELRSLLRSEGLTLDDLSVAIAGRKDTAQDPPYFVTAYRLAGHPASEFPVTIGLDHPDPSLWQPATISGKAVLVGDQSQVDQSEHVRGRPYVWDSASVHYLVTTDDEDWAAEALGKLN